MNSSDAMTFGQARQWATNQVMKQAAGDSFDVDFLLRERFGFSTTELIINSRVKMTATQQAQFQSDIQALLQNKPPQYIVGKTHFYGNEFKVTEATLIPRIETAELIDWILSVYPDQQQPLSVLDIGTGTGAIAITLKKLRPNWHVVGSDISSSALAVAQNNAAVNQVAVDFVLSDVFDNISQQYDLIVSNPPYIAESERELMDTRVLEFEPALALFAPDNGLAIYKKIVAGVNQHLTDHGQLFFEIGFQQGQAITEIMKHQFPNNLVEVKRDVAKKPRMVRLDLGVTTEHEN